MFSPKYNITDKLLSNIKTISSLVDDLNERRFPGIVLVEMESLAREVSVYASTSIEGNPLPLTEVKKILKSKPEHIRESEKEILNYNQALQELNKKLKDGDVALSLERILIIQKRVTEDLLPRYESGHIRQLPVVVNDPQKRQIRFLPPDASDVESLITELIDYVNASKNKVDPLILAGVFHKQMVLIHPFTDGNGRTTRLATKVLLAEMGLNTFNLFSFENYYNQNVTRYFNTVGETGNYYDLVQIGIDFTPWLEYFTEGIIDELLRVQKSLPIIGLTPQTQLQPYHLAILDFIRKNGFIADKDYRNLTRRAKATRALDFGKMLEMDLLERRGAGRATYYVLKEN